jgi:hypothetical protein
MPAIEPNMLKSVFYVYPSEDDAKNSSELGGTGFFFGIPYSGSGSRIFLYAITCHHILLDIKPDPIVLRINTREGKFDTIKTNYDDWTAHPNGDDVAFMRLDLGENHNFEIGIIPPDDIPTDEYIKETGIYPGDEAFMIGRFRVHSGKKKNLPAAMFGYISMLPDEKIYNPKTTLDQESYLVEMRSISGFSGSPVFQWIDELSMRPHTGKQSLKLRRRLLGVCWGYINVPEFAENVDIPDEKHQLKLNSSMAAIVPYYKIMDLINSEEEMELREEENRKLKEKNENS